MRTQRRMGLIAVLAVGAFAQQAKQKEAEGARELYYFAVTKKDPLPPLRRVAATRTPAVTAAPAVNSQQSGTTAAPLPRGDAPAAGPPAGPGAGAVHLGFRYSLALVNSESGKAEPVDSDRVFRKGECLAIDFESNRSGYLYVLVQQSSGNWAPLLPSPEMPDEANIINPGEKVRVPKEYCFEISDPPGTETVFVVLSRDPRDIYDLNEGIKGNSPAPAPRPAAPERPPSDPVQYADARIVNSAIARMAQQFGTRDIVIRKIGQPMEAKEPAHAVYVVNASTRPSSSVVTQIEIHHR